MPTVNPAELLVAPDTFATTLLVIAMDGFGTEVLTWHPDTVQMELEAEYGVKIPQHNLDRLMAACTIITTDYFFKSLTRFIDLCSVLAGASFDPGVVSIVDAAECAWGITEALLLYPPEEAEPFSDDIRNYITEVLKSEGIVKPPDVLGIALGGDFSQQVEYDFGNDPELFSMIYKTQTGKSDDITNMIHANLAQLLQQVTSLPLRNGSTADLLKRIQTDVHVGG